MLKSRCWQGRFLSESPGESCFYAFFSFRGCPFLHFASASAQSLLCHHITLSDSHHHPPQPSYKDLPLITSAHSHNTGWSPAQGPLFSSSLQGTGATVSVNTEQCKYSRTEDVTWSPSAGESREWELTCTMAEGMMWLMAGLQAKFSGSVSRPAQSRDSLGQDLTEWTEN